VTPALLLTDTAVDALRAAVTGQLRYVANSGVAYNTRLRQRIPRHAVETLVGEGLVSRSGGERGITWITMPITDKGRAVLAELGGAS
jgi:hypothetical protein